MNSLEVYIGSKPGAVVSTVYNEYKEVSGEYTPQEGETIVSKEIRQYRNGDILWMYVGSPKIQVRAPLNESQEKVRLLAGVFPKYRKIRPAIEQLSGHLWNDLVLTIPRRCRISALFEDVDYSAPVWLNVLALLLYSWPWLNNLWLSTAGSFHSSL
jgi:hypothetical protein